MQLWRRKIIYKEKQDDCKSIILTEWLLRNKGIISCIVKYPCEKKK